MWQALKAFLNDPRVQAALAAAAVGLVEVVKDRLQNADPRRDR